MLSRPFVFSGSRGELSSMGLALTFLPLLGREAFF